MRRAIIPNCASRRKVCSVADRTGDRSGQMRIVWSSGLCDWRWARPSGPGQRSHSCSSAPVPRRCGTSLAAPRQLPLPGSADNTISARPPAARRGSNAIAASGAPQRPAISASTTSCSTSPTSASAGAISRTSSSRPATSPSSSTSATSIAPAAGTSTHAPGARAATSKASGAASAAASAARAVGTITPPAPYFGASVCSIRPATRASTSRPSISAAGDSNRRWRSTALASALTSSGRT